MFTLLSAEAATHQMTAWDQFSTIISKPDNMPVAGALILVMFFSGSPYAKRCGTTVSSARGRRIRSSKRCSVER